VKEISPQLQTRSLSINSLQITPGPREPARPAEAKLREIEEPLRNSARFRRNAGLQEHRMLLVRQDAARPQEGLEDTRRLSRFRVKSFRNGEALSQRYEGPRREIQAALAATLACGRDDFLRAARGILYRLFHW